MTVTNLRISEEEGTARLAQLLGYDAGGFNDMINAEEMGLSAVRQRMVREAWSVPVAKLGMMSKDDLKELQGLRLTLGRF